MRNLEKEKPLIETEGLIKGLHPTSSTHCRFVQSLSEEMNNSIGDAAPRKSNKLASFVRVGVPVQKIVEGLVNQGNRRLNG